MILSIWNQKNTIFQWYMISKWHKHIVNLLKKFYKILKGYI